MYLSSAHYSSTFGINGFIKYLFIAGSLSCGSTLSFFLEQSANHRCNTQGKKY
jgi:hypothetical protein